MKTGRRNTVERKGFPEQTKEAEIPPTPTVRSPIRKANFTTLAYMQRT